MTEFWDSSPEYKEAWEVFLHHSPEGTREQFINSQYFLPAVLRFRSRKAEEKA